MTVCDRCGEKAEVRFTKVTTMPGAEVLWLASIFDEVIDLCAACLNQFRAEVNRFLQTKKAVGS